MNIYFIIIGALLIISAFLYINMSSELISANEAIDIMQNSECNSTIQIVNGMFEGSTKTITVQTSGKSPSEVEAILLHEFGHYLQDNNYGENYMYISVKDREAFAENYAATHKIIGDGVNE